MIVYLDTSALVKLYVEEDGSSVVRRAVREAEAVATSRVAFAETRAALAQACRLGRIDEAEKRRVTSAFQADWSCFFLLEVSQAVVELAADQADSWPLRGFDAIHLASALTLARRTNQVLHFLAWDRPLNRAAIATGLLVVGDSGPAPRT